MFILLVGDASCLNSGYIISGDGHIFSPKENMGIKLLYPKEFLGLVGNESG
jgi:hypothetical protein